MVQLKLESTVSNKDAPNLHKWDVNMRKHYAHHQEEIDRLAYQTQRGPRGFAFFGHWTFPYRYQDLYARKSIMEKRQLLGEIEIGEVDEYSKINPAIKTSLKHTFNTELIPVKYGLLGGIGLNLITLGSRCAPSIRILMFATPVLLDYAFRSLRTSHLIHTNEFYSWCIQRRTALARAELDSGDVLRRIEGYGQYQKELGDINLRKAYASMYEL